MKKQELTPLQQQYLQDCAMLQAIGCADDLFDGLYLAHVESLKKNNEKTY
jgi:hypothetical protein